MSFFGKPLEIDEDDDSSITSSKITSPTVLLRTNKRGIHAIPLELQHRIYKNVLECGGHDDFIAYCNRNPDSFGVPNSTRRRKCYQKRRHYLKLLEDNPQEFYKLRSIFDVVTEIQPTLPPKEQRLKSSPVSLSSTSELSVQQISRERVRVWPSSTPPPKELKLKPSPVSISSTSELRDRSVPPERVRVWSSSKQKMSSEIPHYELDFRRPENNPNGWMVFEVTAVEYDNELKDMILLQKHLHDMMDLAGGGLKLSLSECGTQILVEEQSVPTYMGSHFTDSTLSLASDSSLQFVHKAVNNAIELMLQDVDNIQERQAKRYVLLVPEGVKLLPGKLNTTSDRFLSGKLDVIQTELDGNEFGSSVALDCYHPVMNFLIERESERRVLRRETTVGNELMAFFSRATRITKNEKA